MSVRSKSYNGKEETKRERKGTKKKEGGEKFADRTAISRIRFGMEHDQDNIRKAKKLYLSTSKPWEREEERLRNGKVEEGTELG